MNKLKKGYVLTSSAYSIMPKILSHYSEIDKKPEIGDVVYGEIESIGEHNCLENGQGRIHLIHTKSKAIFVFGNRYAPDCYEGILAEENTKTVDLLARSGVIGQVISKSAKAISPTKVNILGYVCDPNGKIVNTTNHRIITPKNENKKYPRAKLILVIGTAMNSGKSSAAVACTRALTIIGKEVRASKITGTASLKDILHMNDAGAKYYSDFSFLGYPSTYKIGIEKVINIFNTLDLKYANNKENYWIVELADGINQKETSELLKSPDVKNRIHKLIFCAADAFGAIGGLNVLKKSFNLVPDAISGICSSSPLHIRELSEYTEIPVFNSLDTNHSLIGKLLTTSKRKPKLILTDDLCPNMQ